MLALANEVASEGKEASNRQLAGLYIKNIISAKVSRMSGESKEFCVLTRWTNGFMGYLGLSHSRGQDR